MVDKTSGPELANAIKFCPAITEHCSNLVNAFPIKPALAWLFYQSFYTGQSLT